VSLFEIQTCYVGYIIRHGQTARELADEHHVKFSVVEELQKATATVIIAGSRQNFVEEAAMHVKTLIDDEHIARLGK